MPRHSPLSSQNWKPTSSLLPTDLSLSFLCFNQTHDYSACDFAGSVCACVGVFVYVCVCVWRVRVLKWVCLSAFVSALGSHEMGRHKLPIIIIIVIIIISTPRSGSVHSGPASWDYCDRVLPDELRVSSFPDRFPHYAWIAACVWWATVCIPWGIKKMGGRWGPGSRLDE